jgi:pyruvate dehydrogenase E1 component
MYLLEEADGADGDAPRVQLLGSGAILREVREAAHLLAEQFGVAADVWSVTSFSELARDGNSSDRWNRLHPDEDPRQSYVGQCLGGRSGPVVASTDYMRSVSDQIRGWVPARYVTLGTDGFGRSDTRERLRSFFEVDRHSVALAALKALADEGAIPAQTVKEAIEMLDIETEGPDPWTV